jgi:hypothetical protein
VRNLVAAAKGGMVLVGITDWLDGVNAGDEHVVSVLELLPPQQLL